MRPDCLTHNFFWLRPWIIANSDSLLNSSFEWCLSFFDFLFLVRLSGGFAPYAGQVIVYHQGVWGTVCDDGWDESDALVVCRELGYTGVTMATKGSFFGSAGTINIEMVACYGNETRLSQCSYKTSVEQSACRTGWRRNEAGVICQAGNNTDVRGRVLRS